jgi:2-oxoglutarate ferredoxin oxidoreductase subunit gamma
MRKEIRISGFGGQGVGLAGFILGKAFSIYADLEAVMTQSYGPEARGGASSANIVVADRPIDFPFVQNADILVALSQEAYTRYRPEARQDALVLIDGGLVSPLDDDPVLKIPATELAETLGRKIVANMVMLGFFAAHTELVQAESIKESIETSVRPKTIPLNLEAFQIGFEYIMDKEQILE